MKILLHDKHCMRHWEFKDDSDVGSALKEFTQYLEKQ